MTKNVFSFVVCGMGTIHVAIEMLCGLIKPYAAMHGDLIYKKDEPGRELFIIIEGIVEEQHTESGISNKTLEVPALKS